MPDGHRLAAAGRHLRLPVGLSAVLDGLEADDVAVLDLAHLTLVGEHIEVP